MFVRVNILIIDRKKSEEKKHLMSGRCKNNLIDEYLFWRMLF